MRARSDALLLELPAGFSFPWVLSFLRPRVVAGVETVGAAEYVRTIRLDGVAHIVRLSTAAAAGREVLRIEATPPLDEAKLRDCVSRLLDLEHSPAAFHRHVEDDAVLGALTVGAPPIRLIRFPDPFEALLRAILGQQVSLAAAATAASRLAARLGQAVVGVDGSPMRALPTPGALAATTESDLRAMGLTGARARALISAAAAVLERRLDLEQLALMAADDADAALRALPGVGPWTAAYVRMRGLGDADAFPASDLGVLKALARRLACPRVSAAKALALAEAWRPWRAYAVLHLWQSLQANSS